MNVGVVDRLLSHVYHMSKVTREAQRKSSLDLKIFEYDVSVVAVVDCAKLRFGSSHTFTNPLFEVKFSHVHICTCTLLSQSGWFVPEKESSNATIDKKAISEKGGCLESDNGNELHFRSTLSAMYLNTKHNYMECLLESYPCFGHVKYKLILQDSFIHCGYDSQGMLAV